MNFETLHDLLVEQLQAIYNAELQLLDFLPKMAASTENDELRKAFDEHVIETRDHVSRLREALGEMGATIVRKPCPAITGLIQVAEEVMDSTGDPRVLDAALIATAQRIEHFEISAYGCIKAFAKREELDNIVSMMEVSSKEEGAMDKLLSKLAEGSFMHKSVNKEAARA